jgi:repressor LexA
LRLREIHLETQPLKHLGHRDSDLWEHLIDDAGNEQGDARFHWLRPGMGMKSNCGSFLLTPPLDVPLFFAHNRTMALTKRQKEVLDFIADFVEQNGYSPSYEELAHGLKLASLATVHKHIQALESRNYLRRLFNQSRSLEVSSKYIQERRKNRQAIQSTEVPLAGRIAAGSPVEAIEGQDTLQFADFAGKGDTFALQVSGESMIEDHIMSGDYVLVERTQQANDGEIVVALVGGRETTLKRLHHEPGGHIRLQPANSAMQPIIVEASEVQIQGRVLAVLRKYR